MSCANLWRMPIFSNGLRMAEIIMMILFLYKINRTTSLSLLSLNVIKICATNNSRRILVYLYYFLVNDMLHTCRYISSSDTERFSFDFIYIFPTFYS